MTWHDRIYRLQAVAVGRRLEFVDDVETQRDLAVFAEINKWPLHSIDYRVGPIPT